MEAYAAVGIEWGTLWLRANRCPSILVRKLLYLYILSRANSFNLRTCFALSFLCPNNLCLYMYYIVKNRQNQRLLRLYAEAIWSWHSTYLYLVLFLTQEFALLKTLRSIEYHLLPIGLSMYLVSTTLPHWMNRYWWNLNSCSIWPENVHALCLKYFKGDN